MIIVKNIIGYEGLYLIDNLGNVVSLPKLQGSKLHNKYKIMGTKVNRNGYAEVALTKDGSTKTIPLHRLIAKHFVPNPENKPCVNHKNGVKTDNRIANLEWVTKQENTKHAFDNNLGNFKSHALNNFDKWNREHGYIKVVLVRNDEEHCFSSVKEAADFLNTNRDAVTYAIRKSQRVKGYQAYGVKFSDCANGEAS